MNTVLLVEDSLTERELLTSYLRQAGMNVLTAHNAQEAKAQLQAQRPDLVILDIILPDQSGFEICRELREDTDTKQLPVLICSTKGTNADKMWSSMLGANGHLTKPIEEAEFIQTVRQLMMQV